MLPLQMAAAAASAAPHIISLMSDDVGWNNVGFHNSAVSSPNIDALRSDGIELTRHYAYKFVRLATCLALPRCYAMLCHDAML